MDVSTIESPQPAEDPEQLVPRLGLKHLILWMFISASIIAWVTSGFGGRGAAGVFPVFNTFLQVTLSVVALGLGGMFTASIALLTVSWRCRRVALSAPGHWIAVAQSFNYLWTALVIVSVWSTAQNASGNYISLVILSTLGNLLQAVVYILAWYNEPTSRWRWLFACAALIELSILLANGAASITSGVSYSFSFWLMPFKELVSLGFVLVGAVEFMAGKRRDWVHTVSIACLLILLLPQLFRLIAALVFLLA